MVKNMTRKGDLLQSRLRKYYDNFFGFTRRKAKKSELYSNLFLDERRPISCPLSSKPVHS
jgi:hypothetical protein